MRKYLFLGGPADGTHRAVMNSHPVFTIREIPQLSPDSPPDEIKNLAYTLHKYTRREMTGGHCVYAHTSIPTHEILPRLLSCYNPDKHKEFA